MSSFFEGRLIMNWMNYLAIILLFVFLAANANAQENDPLGRRSEGGHWRNHGG